MAAKQIVFDTEARSHLKAGIDALANAVKVTLGPRGRNVALDKKWGPPTVTHDGVTVAKEIELKRDIDKGTEAVVQAIRSLAAPVKGRRDIEQIATVSANDAEIGRLVAKAMDRVGTDGVITVEEGKGLRLEVEYTEGMQFDRGYISSYFVTDQQRMEA